jgi:23S rRNA (adenine2503-C2)-methyltransferase
MLRVLPQLPATLESAHETLPLLGLALSSLEQILDSRPRALAALRALYLAPPPTCVPTELAGVSVPAWNKVKSRFHVSPWRICKHQVAQDGTHKYAIAFGTATNDQAVETVLIPGQGRQTVCVSSQVGCTRACTFCATAAIGFRRNLSADEIILQYLIAAHDSDAPEVARTGTTNALPRNVVFMGMGEPLDNIDNVLAAIAVLTGTPVPSLRAEHITVSTSGIGSGMERFLRESNASFALSLNGTTDEQRTIVMPQTKKWPLAELFRIIRQDAASKPKRRYFMEYVMLAGHNDSDADADRLPALLAGLPAHISLIPHNPFPGSPFLPSSHATTIRFRDRLHHHGIRALIRTPRGQDIAAACGQLARS